MIQRLRLIFSVTVFFRVLFFQEHLTAGNIFGMVLVAAGVAANVGVGKRAEVIATTNVVKPYN